MGAFYGSKICRGEMMIDDVPVFWREKTEKWLKENI